MLNNHQIERIRKIIGELGNLKSRIEKGIITAKEFNEAFHGGSEKVYNLLERESDEWKFFNNY